MPPQADNAATTDGLLDGSICPDCAEPVEACQAKANIKGACWRWNEGSPAAYLRLFGWFALGIASLGAYVALALRDFNLFYIWPLLVAVGLSIFKCYTVADA